LSENFPFRQSAHCARFEQLAGVNDPCQGVLRVEPAPYRSPKCRIASNGRAKLLAVLGNPVILRLERRLADKLAARVEHRHALERAPADDHLRFLALAGRLNARHVPGAALWMQGAWASVLALSGRYGDLLDYVIIAELLFYLLTVGGLLALVRRSGERPRGAGYPWLQIGYLGLVGALVVDLLITKPAYTWGSVAVVASGVPFYPLCRPKERT